MVLALQGPLVVLSKCVKFHSFDSSGVKMNDNIYLNIGSDEYANADDYQATTIAHLFFKNG